MTIIFKCKIWGGFSWNITELLRIFITRLLHSNIIGKYKHDLYSVGRENSFDKDFMTLSRPILIKTCLFSFLNINLFLFFIDLYIFCQWVRSRVVRHFGFKVVSRILSYFTPWILLFVTLVKEVMEKNWSVIFERLPDWI